MISTTINRIIAFIRSLESRIAFYPVTFGLASFIISVTILAYEDNGLTSWIEDAVPQLIIRQEDTARSVLNSLLGAMISMLVFTFSMVMLLLSQAANNYSPRVLPGLISNKRHQVVLGIFVASIVYCLLTIISIDSNKEGKYLLPSFSILLAIVITIIALGAFVYFIHSISQEIQITNMLAGIYNKTKIRLEYLIDEEQQSKEVELTSTYLSHNQHAKSTGYIQSFTEGRLTDYLKEHKLVVSMCVYKGEYVHRDSLLFRSSRVLTEDEEKYIHSCINYGREELVHRNYVLGFKEITEVGVRAMSPGVNDPGTAINTINLISNLFAIRLRKSDNSILPDDAGNALLILQTINFDDLLYYVVACYRQYSKQDIVVMHKLTMMLNYLHTEARNTEHQKSITKNLDLVMDDARRSIQNEYDLKRLEQAAAFTLTSSLHS